MSAHIKYPIVAGLKECGVCHQRLPVTSFDKSRRHYVSACKPCKRAYSKEYRQRPNVKLASLEYSRRYRSIPKNRERINAAVRRSRKRTDSTLRNAKRREWAAREKQKAVEYKGGRCVCCGYFGCLAALDFHHRNPKEKEGYGSGALKAHWTFERNKPEIDKCELVCVRCHREIHAGARTLP